MASCRAADPPGRQAGGLVTLTGPGGTGKTRLAIFLATDLADEYADGVYFVPLDSVRHGDQIWPAIAQVLELPANGQSHRASSTTSATNAPC